MKCIPAAYPGIFGASCWLDRQRINALRGLHRVFPQPNTAAQRIDMTDNDLLLRLRALSRYEHSDYSIGDEAADEIERLRAEVAASLEREARFVLQVALVMLEDGE